MSRLHWQKSTYCGDASNCVNLAAAPTGRILLRESDTPTTILTTAHAPSAPSYRPSRERRRRRRVSPTHRPHS